MFLDEVMSICDRVMRQAAEEHPAAPCFQKTRLDGASGRDDSEKEDS